MFEKFSRSWALVKASASVLRQDTELLVFPAVSAVATLLVMATFFLPLLGLHDLGTLKQGGNAPIWVYPWLFAFYLSQYFVIFFFNTALVGAAMIRLDGGDPTVSDGLRIARGKIWTILGYALVAATVGMILRAVEERAGTIGKWISGLFGAAWTVVSFLAVPVLVSRDVGPIEAVKESALLLKKTWGENVIGQGGVGLVFGLLHGLAIVLMVVGFIAAGVTKSVALAVVVGIVGVLTLLGLALIQAALSGIYSAALYRHAMGESTQGMAPGLLSAAFAAKR